MINSATSGLPSAYSPVDSISDSGKQAIEIAKIIIQKNISSDGKVDTRQLSRFVDTIIRQINHETGITLPSVKAANSEANNNPTNPDQWDWSSWDSKLFPNGGTMRDLGWSTSHAICNVMGGNIGADTDKIIRLLKQDSFKNSLREGCAYNHLKDHNVKCLVKSERRDVSKIFDGLFRSCDVVGGFKPTGMIKAAIELGYLPQKDIQALYDIK